LVSNKKYDILIDMPNFGIFFIHVLYKKLPIVIIQKIYEDYLEPDIVYKKIIFFTNIPQSIQLHITDEFLLYIKTIIYKLSLRNKLLIPHITNNFKIFKKYYEEHYIKKNKYFDKMNIDNSFIQCILMALYH